MSENTELPKHIGIIMDGNGRWAKLRNLPRSAGHKAGAKTFKNIMTHCGQRGIKHVTVYAFSTENWNRPEEEVTALLDLMTEYLGDSKNYYKDNIKFNIIGDKTAFSKELRESIAKCENDTKDHTGMVLNVALNYGGRHEIVTAIKKIAMDLENNKITIDDIDEHLIEENLYTKGQPNVDLIIRPSGEYRLSNFMLWQSAYAEYVFMDTLWPDFSPKELDKAIQQFAKRNRRFGAIKE